MLLAWHSFCRLAKKIGSRLCTHRRCILLYVTVSVHLFEISWALQQNVVQMCLIYLLKFCVRCSSTEITLEIKRMMTINLLMFFIAMIISCTVFVLFSALFWLFSSRLSVILCQYLFLLSLVCVCVCLISYRS